MQSPLWESPKTTVFGEKESGEWGELKKSSNKIAFYSKEKSSSSPFNRATKLQFYFHLHTPTNRIRSVNAQFIAHLGPSHTLN